MRWPWSRAAVAAVPPAPFTHEQASVLTQAIDERIQTHVDEHHGPATPSAPDTQPPLSDVLLLAARAPGTAKYRLVVVLETDDEELVGHEYRGRVETLGTTATRVVLAKQTPFGALVVGDVHP